MARTDPNIVKHHIRRTCDNCGAVSAPLDEYGIHIWEGSNISFRLYCVTLSDHVVVQDFCSKQCLIEGAANC